jgi:hypothetical protein
VIDLPLEESHPLYQTGLAGLRELAPWSGSPLAAKQLFGLEEEAVLS